MESLTDLKAILHSKRANIYYLEKCRVMQKDGRVLYLTEEKDENHYWNIPIANTTCLLLGSETKINNAQHVNELMQAEAELTKQLYRYAASRTGYKKFSRQRENTDKANILLNHGNYLAYGLAATTLWVLGIPHGFAVMHGKTRRGALVFDVADLIKDAIILPWAFICAKEKATNQEFRAQCLQSFTDHKALDFMFEEVKAVALNTQWDADSHEVRIP